MIADTAYIARRLQSSGEWDAALALLGPDADPELRAEIAYDRWLFRMTGHDAAEQAIAALDPGTPRARLLHGRLAYSRLLFRTTARPGDRADAEAGYRDALRDGDEHTRGWAEFHWGTLLDNIDQDADAALPHFENALALSLKTNDIALEAIAIRHLSHRQEQGERLRMLRRSLQLRAALGARPWTLAAQASLAAELPEDDPERAELTEIYLAGAAELGIAWLLGGGSGTSEQFED
jgi:hypothetical protein